MIVVNLEYWYPYDKYADKNDPDTFDGGDYIGIILYVNGKPVSEYGDSYDDRSVDKIEGFLECLKLLGYEIAEGSTSKMCSSRKPWNPTCKKLVSLKEALDNHASA